MSAARRALGKMGQVFDRERARIKAVGDVALYRGVAEIADERSQQAMTANRLMVSQVVRLTAKLEAAREEVERQKSMYGDLWEAYERKCSEVDYYKREVMSLNERLTATYSLADQVARGRGREILDSEVPPAPIRLVKEGAA